MKRDYYLYTILRNGQYETIADAYSNPILFLIVEKELGNETYLLNQLVITEEEYKYYHSIKN